MKRFFKYAFVFALSASVFTACTDDDDDSVTPNGGTNVTPNEEEVITTLGVVTFSNQVAQDTFLFRDLDGDGGNDGVVDTLRIPADSTFNVQLYFLDESDPNDIENKTAEILAEADEHFICYEVQGGNNEITVSYNDQDANNLDLGIDTDWTTSSSANGTFRITLRHQDGGVKDGTCAPGDSDIEVDFPFVLQ